MKTTEFQLSKTQKTIVISLFILLFLFPIFHKLTKIPLYRWDESLYAQCAYELASTGHSLNKWDNYFLTKEPLYVSKPPMVIWLQAGFMKIFGYESLLALRLHSAIAAFLTLLLLLYFSYSEFKNIFYGLFSGFVLITTHGYLYFHIVRTGDMDGLLIFFTTLMIFYFYKYLKYFDNVKDRNRNLAVVTFALICGVLTKTAAAFFFLPGMLVFAIYKKHLLKILKLGSTYIAIGSFILVIGGYYFIKNLSDPGILKHLWEHDLGGRLFTTIHWSGHPYYFYIQYIFTSAHLPWLLFIPMSILIFFFLENKEIKEFLIYCFICIITYLIIISSATTKITWYMAQIYPIASMIAALSIYYIFIELYKTINKNQFIIKFIYLILFLVIIFLTPYYHRIKEINHIVYTDKVHMGETYDIYEDCLAKMRDSEDGIKKFTVYHELRDSLMNWNPQLLFYQKLYNQQYNFDINISYDPKVFEPGNVVLSNKNSAKEVLSKYYQYDIILTGRDSEFLKITGIKNEEQEKVINANKS